MYRIGANTGIAYLNIDNGVRNSVERGGAPPLSLAVAGVPFAGDQVLDLLRDGDPWSPKRSKKRLASTQSAVEAAEASHSSVAMTVKIPACSSLICSFSAAISCTRCSSRVSSSSVTRSEIAMLWRAIFS